MKGYVFDPSRLARSPKQLECDGYAMAGRLLREYLGSERGIEDGLTGKQTHDAPAQDGGGRGGVDSAGADRQT